MRTKNKDLMERMLSYIDNYIEQYDVSPNVKELSTALDTSTATVSRYMQYMRENGMLDYSGHKGIVTEKMKKTKEETVKVPVLGNISCGIPKYAEGNIEEYVRLPVSLFGPGEFFLLRAYGDSMIEAGIDDGDLVLIRQQNSAEPGEIVIALMDDEATLKRFYPEPENNRIRLHPENKEMSDIYVENCVIQGVAVNVIKKLR
jgi:repressor LexA